MCESEDHRRSIAQTAGERQALPAGAAAARRDVRGGIRPAPSHIDRLVVVRRRSRRPGISGPGNRDACIRLCCAWHRSVRHARLRSLEPHLQLSPDHVMAVPSRRTRLAHREAGLRVELRVLRHPRRDTHRAHVRGTPSGVTRGAFVPGAVGHRARQRRSCDLDRLRSGRPVAPGASSKPLRTRRHRRPHRDAVDGKALSGGGADRALARPP